MEYPLIIVLALTMSMKEPDFNKFVSQHEKIFDSWKETNHGGFKAYLDAKILTFSEPNDIKTLKKQVFLLALYKFKNEPPSAILMDAAKEYNSSLEGLDIDKLTWEDLLNKIKALKKQTPTKSKP